MRYKVIAALDNVADFCESVHFTVVSEHNTRTVAEAAMLQAANGATRAFGLSLDDVDFTDASASLVLMRGVTCEWFIKEEED